MTEQRRTRSDTQAQTPEDFAQWFLEEMSPDTSLAMLAERLFKEAMATAWEEGFLAAEKKANIERGYEMVLRTLGDRAPRPSEDELDPPNPYEA